MENNEILTNEEVMETTEEIVNASSGKGFKVAALCAVFAKGQNQEGFSKIVNNSQKGIKAKKEETQEITDVEFNESDVKDEDSEDISE